MGKRKNLPGSYRRKRMSRAAAHGAKTRRILFMLAAKATLLKSALRSKFLSLRRITSARTPMISIAGMIKKAAVRRNTQRLKGSATKSPRSSIVR
jgi:hypothetical protein